MYHAQRVSIPEDDHSLIFDRIEEVFANGMMAYGKYVERFENEWAKVCGMKYAVATNACTTALEMLVRSLDIPKGKEILLQTNTYIASAQTCLNAGYKVRLFDISDDLNLDIPSLETNDLEGVGAVMIVHVGGNVSVHIDELVDKCADADIPLIEDCAHVHGVNGVGRYGVGGCFSFYPTKLITVGGEGGMLVTNDPDINDFARRYRHHGRINTTEDFEHRDCKYHSYGSNFCMDEVHAIIGLSQTCRLHQYIQNRRRIASIYREKFGCVGSENYYKFVTHDKLRSGPRSGKVYKTPLHKVSYLPNGSFPMSDRFCASHSCIPIYNDQTEDEAVEIMNQIEVVV